MKAVVAAFNQEKALVGAFSVITNLRMELFEALVFIQTVEQFLISEIFRQIRAERKMCAAAESRLFTGIRLNVNYYLN